MNDEKKIQKPTLPAEAQGEPAEQKKRILPLDSKKQPCDTAQSVMDSVMD